MLFFTFHSCSKEDTNTDDNNPNIHTNTITTWAHTFQPSTLNCNIGDTIYFDLGGSHNAIEVSEDSYNNNDPTPIENGFEFGYGQVRVVFLYLLIQKLITMFVYHTFLR